MNDGDIRSHNYTTCTVEFYLDTENYHAFHNEESRWVDSFLFVTHEEDPGVTGKKEIADLIIQIDKSKSIIFFYPVPSESSSWGTSLWATMSSVPAERADIYHVAVEKSELKLINWEQIL